MKYLICRDVYEDYDDSIIYISTEENTEKNDLVVYNGYNRPSLAKVINFMDELSAITSDYHFEPAIKVVSMKAYMEKRATEIKKAKLVKLMKEQMEIQKLEDTLKKNSECNEEMAKLFAQYKELNQ
ncbi:MAG: hypothetical protein IJI66_16650 [Erysipelotrichaceae bacterium]|nr:hypothetical protein [Oscillospiraceae bacterium]MBR0420793.1 hypothetical protein [Erysipelotrichaceae bacterium]